VASPVKISDSLLEAARSTAEVANRSVTKQIEHWAELGRAVEALLPLPDLASIKGPMADPGNAQKNKVAREALSRLTAALEQGTKREPAIATIRSTGKPVYEADAEDPARVVQVHPDGTRLAGRFVGGAFVADRGTRKRRAG
jgi:hypothetical protein